MCFDTAKFPRCVSPRHPLSVCEGRKRLVTNSCTEREKYVLSLNGKRQLNFIDNRNLSFIFSSPFNVLRRFRETIRQIFSRKTDVVKIIKK